MPSKRWFVQIYPVGGTPQTPMLLTDPEKVCALIDESDKMGYHDTAAVYSTAMATNKEDL
ncbi:MAG TPA: hypothetical protein VIF37_11190 [Methylobacter sp.]|jgi:hypothetical protein